MHVGQRRIKLFETPSLPNQPRKWFAPEHLGPRHPPNPRRQGERPGLAPVQHKMKAQLPDKMEAPRNLSTRIPL